MNDRAIEDLFAPLYSDIRPEDEFFNKKPLLAHYTSLDALEKIFTTNEILFSNPLFMNDFEEVRFGILNGILVFKGSDAVRAAFGTEVRQQKFSEALDLLVTSFEAEHLLDTYVFCLSLHPLQNGDGLLSMWRGYGGNGKGAAIVFDTSKLGVINNSPLVLAKVHYGSASDRIAHLQRYAALFAKIATENYIPDDRIPLASKEVFDRVKMFSLFTKHHGFKEENEWRVVYMSDRDRERKFRPLLSYHNGPRGIEPKLRFKIPAPDGVTPSDFSIEQIVAGIILGPSVSSVLAVRSVSRMLELIGKPQLSGRVIASSIPYRAG